MKATNNGASWVSYHSSEPIKKTVDMYLTKLNEFTSSTTKAEKKQTRKDAERKQHDEIIKEAMKRQGDYKTGKAQKEYRRRFTGRWSAVGRTDSGRTAVYPPLCKPEWQDKNKG
ncbi:MAG: hypothetical protein IPH18_09055 [Chitinophagaceae bacterium]|nr:hypothetical protein [Chitinophagaceae bacterium]